MKMKKFWQNQKGVSLVEATIAMALTSAAGVAYMTHVQTVAKNEAQQKVRASLTLLESQAADYLKSKDICNENMNKAFDGLSLNQAKHDGHSYHKSLLGKSFINSSGVKENKEIFKVDNSYDGDRLWVSDINYRLKDLENRVIPNSPWNKTGRLVIEVVFERCSNGGAVYRRSEGGAKVPVCDQIVKHSKIFEKDAAFKVDSTGKIGSKPSKVWNPATQKYVVDTSVMVNQAACADSQDALVDEAKEYADKKVCLLDAKMMANSGRSGLTSCNYNVTTSEVKDEYTTPGETPLALPSPYNVVPGTLRFEMIGGGGGGGGASDDRGRGGKAGVYKADLLSEAMLGSDCKLTVGAGGKAGYDDDYDGGTGGITKLDCTGHPVISVAGGAGGASDQAQKGGDDKGEGGESSHYGPGGADGANKNGDNGVAAGSGGAGAGDDQKSSYGGTGANGKVVVAWKGVRLFDDAGIEISMLTGEPVPTRDPATERREKGPLSRRLRERDRSTSTSGGSTDTGTGSTGSFGGSTGYTGTSTDLTEGQRTSPGFKTEETIPNVE